MDRSRGILYQPLPRIIEASLVKKKQEMAVDLTEAFLKKIMAFHRKQPGFLKRKYTSVLASIAGWKIHILIVFTRQDEEVAAYYVC